MSKIVVKSQKMTSFGGIFPIMEIFEQEISPYADRLLGRRCTSFGYQYSEIIRSLMCVYFCGGTCVEDVSSYLKHTLSLHPELRTCSADTILRGIKELKQENITYVSKSGKAYDFNPADKLNELLVDVLLATGQLEAGKSYDLDFDHDFLKTEKNDAKFTYKKFRGYSPGVATIGDLIVGIENRDGNANVKFHQQDTLQRIFERMKQKDIFINNVRMDCGSCSRLIVKTVMKYCKFFYIRGNRCHSIYNVLFALQGWKHEEINDMDFDLNSIQTAKWEGIPCRIVIQRKRRNSGESMDLWEGEYTYRYIITNDYDSTEREIVEYYNQRGAQERIFDEMNNGFGWKSLPKSFMDENTVFLLMTALIRNFYLLLKSRMGKDGLKAFGLKKNSRIKTFVFRFVSVPAKWIQTAREKRLNIYSENQAYRTDFNKRSG